MFDIKLVNGDLVLSGGRPQVITGAEKFQANLQLVIDRYCNLDGLVGFVTDSFSLRVELYRRIQNGFGIFAASQSAIQKFNRPGNERLKAVTNVSVFALDQTSYGFRVDVASDSGTSAFVTGRIG